MKTLKLTLLTLVALMVPASSFAATGGQVVTGSPADAISISASGAASWASEWNAASATNDSTTTTLTVRSNLAWGLEVNADGTDLDAGAGVDLANSAGKMRKYSGSYTAGAANLTANALQVQLSGAVTQSFAGLTTTAAEMGGTGTTNVAATDADGDDITVTYRMPGSYADDASATYRADVTWTATQGL